MRYTPFSHIPKSRAQFENHLHILESKLHNGSVSLSSQMELTITSIKKVRLSSNRRFDLLTIDEFVRNLANTTANADKMTTIKSNKIYSENE